jgi:hypothetical protein
MEGTTRPRAGHLLRRIGWAVLFLIIAIYGAFALTMGISELLFIGGLASEVKQRATPIIFAMHALAGAVVLIIGPLQSVRWIRRRGAVRLALGRTYVIAVSIASVTAVVDAIWFGVSVLAKITFVALATLWFVTTTVGMLRARARRFASQHEWMVRSYALSLFFVTFSLWVPALEATSLPRGIAYPLALFLSGSVNLAAVELWIRRTRKPIPNPGSRPAPRLPTRSAGSAPRPPSAVEVPS